MPRFPGFVGGSYTLENVTADCQMSMNWYPSQDESGTGKAPLILNPTPGTSTFCSLGNGPTRGLFTEPSTKRVFGVGSVGTVRGPDGNLCNFVEITLNPDGVTGSIIGLGDVGNDGKVVSFASDGSQILICSNSALFVFMLGSGAFQPVDMSQFNKPMVSEVGFLDGFFLALLSESRTFQASALKDATTWDPTDFAEVNEFGDNVVSMTVDHEQIILLGNTKSVIYANSGGSLFPFSYVEGSLIEEGCGAPDSAIQADNSIFWIKRDARGSGTAVRLAGYLSTRVSNHAVETAIQAYPTVEDVVSYSYQEGGHVFVVFYFPSAPGGGATWVYDILTGFWHQRGYNDPNFGAIIAHRSWVHTFAFGRHLVGDWAGPGVQTMSVSLYDDAGNPIRRIRRCPHLSEEAFRLFFRQFRLDCESGVGLDFPGTWDAGTTYATNNYVTGSDGLMYQSAADGNLNNDPTVSPTWWVQSDKPGVYPQVCLRWSDDGGRTWSDEYWMSIGKQGAFDEQVWWTGLGSGRDRVFEVSVSDPIPWRLTDAYLYWTRGTN